MITGLSAMRHLSRAADAALVARPLKKRLFPPCLVLLHIETGALLSETEANSATVAAAIAPITATITGAVLVKASLAETIAPITGTIISLTSIFGGALPHWGRRRPKRPISGRVCKTNARAEVQQPRAKLRSGVFIERSAPGGADANSGPRMSLPIGRIVVFPKHRFIDNYYQG